MDLFHLWSIENNKSINMGVQVRKWLATQSKDNVICVFICSLVTALCHGLGLEGNLRAEKVIARMEPITVEDLDQAKLARGGDGKIGRMIMMKRMKETTPCHKMCPMSIIGRV